MKKIVSIILVTIITISLVSCGSSKSALVGRWEDPEGGSISWFEFFSDGTYTTDHPNYSGTYSVDGDRLKITGILVSDETMTFKISGNKLEISQGKDKFTPLQNGKEIREFIKQKTD